MEGRLKLPRYVHGFLDRHGKARFYLRHPRLRKQIRLEGLPWSPPFMEAYYHALECGVPEHIRSKATHAGSVDAAIVGYYQSLEFGALASNTQKARRTLLERFRVDYGEKNIATMHTIFLREFLATKKPAAARSWLKSLRSLMRHAVNAGLRADDPTQSVKLPPLKSKGIHSWTESEIDQFAAFHAAGSQARLAFSLMLFTGQRRSDVTRMGRQHIQGHWIHITQQKTGVKLQLPIHPDLQAILDATGKDQMTFLVTERGAPFSQAGFGNWFRDRCNEAGLKHCSAHGLRKAACRRLAEAGCSEKQIAAISGHLSLSEVQRYTREADQAKLAEQAMRSIEGKPEKHKPRTAIGKPE